MYINVEYHQKDLKNTPIILIYLIFYRFPGFSYACKCVERCKDNVQPLCEINKENRNACKYCRYKACITLGGMQRKLVKKNQKIIRKDDSISIDYESMSMEYFEM